MMPADTQLRAVFEDAIPSVEPTTAQMSSAWAALAEAIEAESMPVAQPATRPPWWRQPQWAMAGVVAVALIVATAILLPSTAPPLDANLENIARAARQVEAADLPAGSYAYAATDSRVRIIAELPDGTAIDYILPQRIESWQRGRFVETRTHTAPPIFADAASEAAYYAAGLDDDDGVGQTITLIETDIPNAPSVRNLSTNADDLRRQIFSELGQNPDWTPDDEARILEHVAQLMDPALAAPPPLRAALLEIIAGLDVETAITGGGGVAVELAYSDGGAEYLLEVEVDEAGFIRLYRTTLISAADGKKSPGLIEELIYSRPRVAPGAGVVPRDGAVPGTGDG